LNAATTFAVVTVKDFAFAASCASAGAAGPSAAMNAAHASATPALSIRMLKA
jgi:hypothetical protein